MRVSEGVLCVCVRVCEAKRQAPARVGTAGKRRLQKSEARGCEGVRVDEEPFVRADHELTAGRRAQRMAAAAAAEAGDWDQDSRSNVGGARRIRVLACMHVCSHKH